MLGISPFELYDQILHADLELCLVFLETLVYPVKLLVISLSPAGRGFKA